MEITSSLKKEIAETEDKVIAGWLFTAALSATSLFFLYMYLNLQNNGAWFPFMWIAACIGTAILTILNNRKLKKIKKRLALWQDIEAGKIVDEHKNINTLLQVVKDCENKIKKLSGELLTAIELKTSLEKRIEELAASKNK